MGTYIAYDLCRALETGHDEITPNGLILGAAVLSTTSNSI